MRGQVSKSVLMRLLQRRTEYVGVEKESERGRHSGDVFDVETPRTHVSPVNNGRTDALVYDLRLRLSACRTFPSSTGFGQKVVPRLCECCRQNQAEVVSNSRNKLHQTWPKPFS